MIDGSRAHPSAGARAAQAPETHGEALAVEITGMLYAEMPELLTKYGERAREECLQDMRYNLEHLAPAVEMEEPQVFDSYTLWLNDLLRARNVPTAEVLRSLEPTERVGRERMPAEEADAVARCLHAGMYGPGGPGA